MLDKYFFGIFFSFSFNFWLAFDFFSPIFWFPLLKSTYLLYKCFGSSQVITYAITLWFQFGIWCAWKKDFNTFSPLFWFWLFHFLTPCFGRKLILPYHSIFIFIADFLSISLRPLSFPIIHHLCLLLPSPPFFAISLRHSYLSSPFLSFFTIPISLCHRLSCHSLFGLSSCMFRAEIFYPFRWNIIYILTIIYEHRTNYWCIISRTLKGDRICGPDSFLFWSVQKHAWFISAVFFFSRHQSITSANCDWEIIWWLFFIIFTLNPFLYWK